MTSYQLGKYSDNLLKYILRLGLNSIILHHRCPIKNLQFGYNSLHISIYWLSRNGPKRSPPGKCLTLPLGFGCWDQDKWAVIGLPGKKERWSSPSHSILTHNSHHVHCMINVVHVLWLVMVDDNRDDVACAFEWLSLQQLFLKTPTSMELRFIFK